MLRLTLYSKPGCHLCDEMKAAITRAGRLFPIALDTVDILGDPALEASYGTEIPVLFVEGKKVAKYRITDEALVRTLAEAERAEKAGGAG